MNGEDDKIKASESEEANTSEGKVVAFWNERYSVTITHIDDQHRELLRLTAEMYEFCRQNSKNIQEQFRISVRKIVEHIKQHFNTEEHIMERISFPDISNHKREHENFIKKILEEVKKFDTTEDFIYVVFVRFLREWFLNHISIWDIEYAKYIIQLKKKGELNIIP